MNKLPENHPRSERKYRVSEYLRRLASEELGKHITSIEDIERMQQENRLLEPSEIITDALIPIHKCAERYSININTLLELAVDGILELCIPIDKAKAVLHVFHKDYLARRDPNSSDEMRIVTAFSEELNTINICCMDYERSEWVALSKEDCWKILKSGLVLQSEFEYGWKMRNCGDFITTYPRFKSNSISIQGESRAQEWRFKSYLREDNHIDKYSGNHIPENPISIKIEIDSILVPKIFIERYIENTTENFESEHCSKLDKEIDEFIEIINSESLQLKKLAELTKLAKEYFDKLDRNNYGVYKNRDKIIEDIKKILIEKKSSQQNKEKMITVAKEAARTITPENYRKEDFYCNLPVSHITRKMIGLAKAYKRFFLEKNNGEPYKNDDIINYLTDKKNAYGFTPSSAKNSISLISLKERRGAPKKTKKSQSSK